MTVQPIVINEDWRITPYSYLGQCDVTGESPTQEGFYGWVRAYLASHYSVDIDKCTVTLGF